jgi:Flp pilus assembly protein TadD
LKTVLSELKAKKPDSALAQESAINTLGYGLLNTGDRTGAITIFRLNTELYPKSGNTYDSLGETLALIGDEAGAISNYKQALAVQPDYGNAAFAKEFLAKHEKTANATAK